MALVTLSQKQLQLALVESPKKRMSGLFSFINVKHELFNQKKRAFKSKAL